MSNLNTINNALEGTRGSAEAGGLVYVGHNAIENTDTPSMEFVFASASTMHAVGVLVTQDDIDNAPSPGVNAMGDAILAQAVLLMS